jgi:hypothetical protein
MHVVLKETQNEKIVEILNDMNESVHHLNINDKIRIKANNEEMYKDQPNLSKQQDMICNFVSLYKLRYVSSTFLN